MSRRINPSEPVIRLLVARRQYTKPGPSVEFTDGSYCGPSGFSVGNLGAIKAFGESISVDKGLALGGSDSVGGLDGT